MQTIPTNTAKDFLSQSAWCALHKDKRAKLAEVFGVPKSGQVKVQDNRLVSDGTEPRDLMNSINLQSVLKFLGQEFSEKKEYNFEALFQNVLAEVFKDEPKVETVAQDKAPLPTPEVKVDESAKTIVVTQKKKGRPKKIA